MQKILALQYSSVTIGKNFKGCFVSSLKRGLVSHSDNIFGNLPPDVTLYIIEASLHSIMAVPAPMSTLPSSAPTCVESYDQIWSVVMGGITTFCHLLIAVTVVLAFFGSTKILWAYLFLLRVLLIIMALKSLKRVLAPVLGKTVKRLPEPNLHPNMYWHCLLAHSSCIVLLLQFGLAITEQYLALAAAYYLGALGYLISCYKIRSYMLQKTYRGEGQLYNPNNMLCILWDVYCCLLFWTAAIMLLIILPDTMQPPEGNKSLLYFGQALEIIYLTCLAVLGWRLYYKGPIFNFSGPKLVDDEKFSVDWQCLVYYSFARYQNADANAA